MSPTQLRRALPVAAVTSFLLALAVAVSSSRKPAQESPPKASLTKSGTVPAQPASAAGSRQEPERSAENAGGGASANPVRNQPAAAAAIVAAAPVEEPKEPRNTLVPSAPANPSAAARTHDPDAPLPSPKRFSAADFLPPGTDLSDPAQRAAVVAAMRTAEQQEKAAAIAKADQLGLKVRIQRPDGTVMELMRFDGDRPVYAETRNANAAISSGANLLAAAPYSVTGAGFTAGIWDGGAVRSTHQEFDGRVTIEDTVAFDDHATHVAGTIGAAGVVARAKGMAPAVHIDSYDWNSDKSEMTSRGASYPGEPGTIYLSNHSYGYSAGWTYTGYNSPMWAWYGSGTTTTSLDPSFGVYDSYARDTDALAASLPYYLIVWAAGNDRSDNPAAGDSVSLSTSLRNVVGYNATIHPQGDGVYKNGYDLIASDAVAKNILTIGAVNDAVINGVRTPSKGTMTDFSSWGPTDDGRIKPDLVANGEDLYSSIATSDTAYDTYSGTSMATPNTTGSAMLLVSYFDKLFPGQAMRASTLKALLINTADDLGTAGPDYQYGWGLINVKAAADLIKSYSATPGTRALNENRLTSASDVRTFSFSWDGVSPIRATLAWTDPAGTASSSEVRTSRLVNDLDLKITGPSNTVYQPWVMPYAKSWTLVNLTAAATRGTNNCDTVEQVYIPSPSAPGTYTASVSCTGTLTGTQAFSLIISGSSAGTLSAPAITSASPAFGSTGTATVALSGSGFALGAKVALTKSGAATVSARGQEAAGESLKFRLDMNTMTAGAWDIQVTNPDGQTGVLPGGFTVAAPFWSENFESGGTGWVESASVGTSSPWTLTSAASHSSGHSIYTSIPVTQNVADLYAPPVNIPEGATGLQLSFWHYYRFASTRSGGVLEFSTDDGATWNDASASASGTTITSGGYTGTFSTSGTTTARNPLAGRGAWTGTNAAFTLTIVDFQNPSALAGKTLHIRWRLATGAAGTGSAAYGWYLDDVVLSGITAPSSATPLPSFASWATTHGLSGDAAAALADPDGDGISNLLEYALATNPLTPGTLPAPDLSGSGQLSLTFTRPRNLPDVIYAVEASSDLTTWTSIPLDVLVDGDTQTVRATDSTNLSSTGRRFMRIRVSRP